MKNRLIFESLCLNLDSSNDVVFSSERVENYENIVSSCSDVDYYKYAGFTMYSYSKLN